MDKIYSAASFSKQAMEQAMEKENRPKGLNFPFK